MLFLHINVVYVPFFDRLIEEMTTMTNMVMAIPVVLTLIMTMGAMAQIVARTPLVTRRIARKSILEP